MGRTQKSIKNGIITIIYSIISIIFSLVTQAVFVRTLGSEYNGIKSLFNSIISMLSLAELGFGTAIIYNLYKPVKENDYITIQKLTNFYRKIYNAIAMIVLIIGLLIMFFLKPLVGEVTIAENIYIIYFLFLIESVASYLLVYKRSILYANQENYIIKIIDIIYIITLNLLQTIFLLITKQFLLYLVLMIICKIVENLTIHIIVNRRYPYLKNIKKVGNIDDELNKNIILNVKGLFFHKISTFIVNGTDSIIISMSDNLGVNSVGLYANYHMITSYVHTIFKSIFEGITASVGNLLLDKDNNRQKQIYKSTLLLNSWIYGFSGILIYFLIDPFIKLWLGNEYLLTKDFSLVLVIYFYLRGLRLTSSTFKDAAGIFYEDRFVPIIVSVVNIVVSIILVKYLGLTGVLLGTIASTMILFLYSYPILVFKKILKGSYMEYVKLHIKHIIITVIIFIINYLIIGTINYNNAIIELICNAIICFIITNILYTIVYFKMSEFTFYKNIILDKIIKKSRKKY